jgi:hypothetical protein
MARKVGTSFSLSRPNLPPIVRPARQAASLACDVRNIYVQLVWQAHLQKVAARCASRGYEKRARRRDGSARPRWLPQLSFVPPEEDWNVRRSQFQYIDHCHWPTKFISEMYLKKHNNTSGFGLSDKLLRLMC